MPQITKINLGVQLIKTGVDVTTITYRQPSEFGWEPGWEPFEIMNPEDYLHPDLINLFNGFSIPYHARLNRIAPNYQFPVIDSRTDSVHIQLGFVLSGQAETQIFDLVGYSTGSTGSSPYPYYDPVHNVKFLMKPGTTDTADPLNYLKPGDIGIGGTSVAPIEISTHDSTMIDVRSQYASKNTSVTDPLYGLVLVTYNVSKEYVESALLPYVVE